MIIGGFQKFSLIDYPGKICSIIFTQGCNFRCPYCHNPELVDPKYFLAPIPEDEVFSFLKTRQGKLDAVEITGGEPTLQKDLINFIQKIKKMDYLVKLDSNGSNPDVLEKIIKMKIVDYLAMDIKGPLEKYQLISNSKVSPAKIKKSIKLIMDSGIDYEFRTTIVKSQINREDIIKIGKLIKGAKLYALQKFIPSKTLDKKFLHKTTYNDEEFKDFKNILIKYIAKCIVR